MKLNLEIQISTEIFFSLLETKRKATFLHYHPVFYLNTMFICRNAKHHNVFCNDIKLHCKSTMMSVDNYGQGEIRRQTIQLAYNRIEFLFTPIH